MNQQDEHTIAEHLADAVAWDQSRGRHGVLEFPDDERSYRRIATERAERVLQTLARRGIAVSRPRVVEAEAKTCDHCGRTMGDFAGGFGRMTRDGIHYNLCHPNDPRRADCYHLVTTRAEAVGARRNTP